MNEETLSSKIWDTRRDLYLGEDVREFIKDLKEEILEWDWQAHKQIEIIEKLAGEELLIPISSTPVGSLNHSPQEVNLPLKSQLGSAENSPEDTTKGCGNKFFSRKRHYVDCTKYDLCPECEGDGE